MSILFWSVRIRRALAISERDGLSHLNSASLAASPCLPLRIELRMLSLLSSSPNATRFRLSSLSVIEDPTCSLLASG